MAAGLGFKTFTTGEVLTAADTNGYLMQGVLVFASAAARDAAITSPQEGQCCYLKDTDAVLTYSGAAWVGFDDSNAIQNTIVDAKGDIVAASASDTPARLAVGNNGETLVADSSTTTGLRYQAPVNDNPVLNSAFQVWQRGTSTSIPASTYPSFPADRWITSTNANQACTVSRQATGDTTNLPNIQYALRYQRNSGQTGTGSLFLIQNFESINSIPFTGKTVTLSFYARKGANYSATSSALGISLITGTGTDQNAFNGFTGSASPISSTATLTTTWQRFSYTGTIATNVTQIAPALLFDPTGTAGAADYYEVTGIQLEVGSVATPFKTYAGTIQGELAACQRYYYRVVPGAAYGNFASGFAYNTTTAQFILPFPVVMRIVPTAIEFSTLAVQDGITFTAVTSTGISYITQQQGGLFAGVASGLTAFRPMALVSNNNSAAYVGYSAEL